MARTSAHQTSLPADQLRFKAFLCAVATRLGYQAVSLRRQKVFGEFVVELQSTLPANVADLFEKNDAWRWWTCRNQASDAIRKGLAATYLVEALLLVPDCDDSPQQRFLCALDGVGSFTSGSLLGRYDMRPKNNRPEIIELAVTRKRRLIERTLQVIWNEWGPHRSFPLCLELPRWLPPRRPDDFFSEGRTQFRGTFWSPELATSRDIDQSVLALLDVGLQHRIHENDDHEVRVQWALDTASAALLVAFRAIMVDPSFQIALQNFPRVGVALEVLFRTLFTHSQSHPDVSSQRVRTPISIEDAASPLAFGCNLRGVNTRELRELLAALQSIVWVELAKMGIEETDLANMVSRGLRVCELDQFEDELDQESYPFELELLEIRAFS